LLLAQFLTGGWFFWHIVVANANPLDLEHFATNAGQFAQLNALPVCVAASLYAFPSRPSEHVWRRYLPLTGVATLLSIGKLGASSNYWLELTAVTAVCVGLVVDRLATVRGPAPFGPAGVAAAVLAALLMSVPAYQATALDAIRSQLIGLAGPTRTQLRAASQLAQEPGDVLTDDPSLSVLAGKPIQFEFVIFTVLAEQGVWDEQPILEAVAARRFSVVVLTGPIDGPPRRLIEARWTEAVAHAIQAAYEFEREQDGYWYYRPRRVATTRPASATPRTVRPVIAAPSGNAADAY
jgi:hypothetical protein